MNVTTLFYLQRNSDILMTISHRNKTGKWGGRGKDLLSAVFLSFFKYVQKLGGTQLLGFFVCLFVIFMKLITSVDK